MNRTNLINEVEIDTGYSAEVIDEVLDSLTTIIGNSLILGEDVIIEEFGVFQSKLWRGRRICDINTGAISYSRDTRVIRFQPAKELKEALK